MAGKGGPRARATTTHSDDMHPVTSISLGYGGVPDQSSEPAANPSQPINSGRYLLAEGSEAIYNSAKGRKYVEVDFEPTEEGLKIIEDLDLRYILHPKGIAALRRKFKAPDDKELQNLLAGVSKIIHQTAKHEEERQNRQAPQVGQQHDSLHGLGFPENAIEDEMDWSALHAGDCIYGLITEFMRSENIPLNDPTHVPSRAGPMILKCYRMVIRYFIGDYAHVYLFVTKEGAGPTAVKRYERDVFEMLYPKGAQYELPKGFKQPMFSEAEYEEEGAMIQRIIYRVHKRSLWRKAKTQLTLDTKVRLYYRDRDFPIHHKRVHESLRDRSGKKMSDELIDSLRDLGGPGPGEVIEIVNDRSARLICAGTSSSPNITTGKGANRESDLEEMELDAARLHNTNAGRNGLSICSSRSTIRAAHNHQRNLFEDYREPLNQYRDESTVPGAQDRWQRGHLTNNADDDTIESGRKSPRSDDPDRKKGTKMRRVENDRSRSREATSPNSRLAADDRRRYEHSDDDSDGYNKTRSRISGRSHRHHHHHSSPHADREKDYEKQGKRHGRSKSRGRHRGGRRSDRHRDSHDRDDRSPRDRNDGRTHPGR